MAGRVKDKKMLITIAAVLVLNVALFYGMAVINNDEVTSAPSSEVLAGLPGAEELGNLVVYPEYLVLVNKTHGLGKDDAPDDLKTVNSVAKDRSPVYQKLRAEAADAFNDLTAAASKEGIVIAMTTAYRPYSFQEQLYNTYMRTKGPEWTEKYSAKPGYSEHQTGLATDVSSPSIGYRLDPSYADTKEGKWLADNAHKFGFIIRYPKGKEDITGYDYEPWHIRYVGKSAAADIYKDKLTLEEYLGEK